VSKLTIELNPKMEEVLAQLARGKHTSKVEVLRRAVALYNYVESQLAEGNKSLAIVEDDKVKKEIVVP
jgi:predicted transcriptional regulator